MYDLGAACCGIFKLVHPVVIIFDHKTDSFGSKIGSPEPRSKADVGSDIRTACPDRITRVEFCINASGFKPIKLKLLLRL